MSPNFTTFIFAHPWIVAAVAIWTLPWKGIALWKAARNQSPVWFIFLLVINTLGMLEIVYIFIFSRKKDYLPQPVEDHSIENIERRVLDIKR